MFVHSVSGRCFCHVLSEENNDKWQMWHCLERTVLENVFPGGGRDMAWSKCSRSLKAAWARSKRCWNPAASLLGGGRHSTRACCTTMNDKQTNTHTRNSWCGHDCHQCTLELSIGAQLLSATKPSENNEYL